MRLFDRPARGERAVLVHVHLHAAEQREELDEFVELTRSAGIVDVATLIASRRLADPKYFVGRGKVDEIQASVRVHEASLVLMDHDLTPSQERNLEKLLECRVMDRTGLILDIFRQRAQSFEGKLQVELAQLQHLSTRLVRGWTHLERQTGGIGIRGGPGETQLEIDRRLVALSIKRVHQRLAKLSNQRDQRRKMRRKSATPTIALVGYTNAGKSTLFNRLTGAQAYTADQLFATLDPTLRRVNLPGAESVVFADTVGFIRHLPHDLVAAFRATLEETSEAALLLHVIDASSDRRDDCINQVNAVLTEIGAGNVRQIEVYNKIDRLAGGTAPRIDRDEQGRVARVRVSALTGAGTTMLRDLLVEEFPDLRQLDKALAIA